LPDFCQEIMLQTAAYLLAKDAGERALRYLRGESRE
jgi:hypothetical protein